LAIVGMMIASLVGRTAHSSPAGNSWPAAARHPGDFRGEALDVVGLALQERAGMKSGK
jgi:hypothetical protein